MATEFDEFLEEFGTPVTIWRGKQSAGPDKRLQDNAWEQIGDAVADIEEETPRDGPFAGMRMARVSLDEQSGLVMFEGDVVRDDNHQGFQLVADARHMGEPIPHYEAYCQWMPVLPKAVNA